MKIVSMLAMAFLLSIASAFGGGGGSSGGSSAPPAIVYADQYVSVSSEDGTALSGVLVLLTGQGSTQNIASAKTDSDGKAYFRLQQGTAATVHVSVSGFEPAEQSITAENGVFRIILKKSQSGGERETENETENRTKRTAYSVRGRSLPCGDEGTMRERVRCRLNAATQDYNSLYYVPEECRAQNDSNRTACLELYDEVQSCRKLEGDSARFACVRGKLGMNGTVNESLRACAASQNPAACIATLRASVLSLAKFKLYNLEERAEYLISEGLDREAVESFVEKMEQYKLDFNAASTIKEKQQILKGALSEWRKFKQYAVSQLKGKGGS